MDEAMKKLVAELQARIDVHEVSSWPKEPLVDLEAPFIDGRGTIQNLLHREMKSAVLISSVAGAVRANHFHKSDWHYCYLITGSMRYFHRASGSIVTPESLIVNAGQMIFTPPLVDHAMEFTKDSMFITLSRNARDPSAYEDDLVRIPSLIEPGKILWSPKIQ